MSIVSLLNVTVLNNPAKFTDPYEFEITFECLEQLKDDLEWKLTYVGSSTSFEHDQELDSLLVGPVPVGVNKFVFQADPPSPDLIPASELVSVTVVILSCSYAGNEFVRVGYYVNNEYDAPELRENPPSRVQVDHVVRNVLAEKPRVTRFNIPWDSDQPLNEYPPEQPDVDAQEEEEEEQYRDEDEDQEGEEEEEEEEEEDEEEEEEAMDEDDNAKAPEQPAEKEDQDAEEDLEETADMDEAQEQQESKDKPVEDAAAPEQQADGNDAASEEAK